MIVLLDLDGTLVHTTDEQYRPMRDGEVDTDPQLIPLISGAQNFVESLKERGHTPLVVSDSVGKYVNPIVAKYFGIPSASLAYKPNVKVTQEFLQRLGIDLSNREEIFVVGDTWLDIELGRAFGFRTVLFQPIGSNSNKATPDGGIGKTWNQLKSGPTYTAKTFNEVLSIIDNPHKSLWCAEAEFQGLQSNRAIRLWESEGLQGHPRKIFRALGRQEDGECDKYGIANVYKEFHREDRRPDTLRKLANAVQTYLHSVLQSGSQFEWNYFTYVSDKATTTPPNKLKELFEITEIGIAKDKFLSWNEVVDGSIRNRPHYKERREFIRDNLNVTTEIDLSGKSIIVIDDQFTTGGTAHEVADMLQKRGAKHILFVTLCFMTSMVMSHKNCPKCGKQMQIKLRKVDGKRFYSCTPPQFRGTGCGYAENYD